MDIEKVKWMFALRASDSGIVEILLLILNIPQYDFNLKVLVEQEISLTYLQTKHFLFRGGGGFFSFTHPKDFCIFSSKICCNETTAPRDLMQRDDGIVRSVRWQWIVLRW
ncbi:uncharacterized protein G2W53_015129 [Senna tora]|uniref:Uncharacterized protein n=1 Tax=Senna tora TaxID=362788 RepID=A0A835C3Q8_9FABA|nr:uncharacterized protein G2W53_015129 [Senna tora]